MTRRNVWITSGVLWILSCIAAGALSGSFAWEIFLIGILLLGAAIYLAQQLPPLVYAILNLAAVAALYFGFHTPAVAAIYALCHLITLSLLQDILGFVVFSGAGTLALLISLWLDTGFAPAYFWLGFASWILLSLLTGWTLRQLRYGEQQRHQWQQQAQQRQQQLEELQQQIADLQQQIVATQQQAVQEQQRLENRCKQVSEGLRICRQAMEQLAVYKLGFHLPETGEPVVDQVVEALKTAEKNLSMILLYYQSLSSNLAQSADVIAEHAKTVQKFLKEQTTQVTGLASAVEELSSTAEAVARTVAATAETSEQTARQAEEGQQAIAQTIGEMKAIIELVQQTTRSVEALSESSAQINAIVQMIEEIAEQINLLALNAAIEAARAGNAGRGFAVVADEVRRLAERTQEATREIATMIDRVHSQTQETVTIVNESNKKAEVGIELAEEAGEALEKIVRGIATVSDQVSQIATAVQQQASTTAAMSHNIGELRERFSNIEQSVAEVTSEQENLARETKNLQEIAFEFDVGQERRQFIEITRQRAQQFARECARILEEGIQKGIISEEDLFDRTYEPIPNTNPQKYHTKFDWFTDKYIQEVEEKYLAMDERYRFAILVDDNGYVPSHNLIYSQPLTGDYETDLVRNRTKRIFNDPTGIRAARNTNPYLLQTYRRDTGEFMNDLSVPVYVRGKHWGAVRIGFVF